MSDFNIWYNALLRKQIEEEIQFLVTNGHDQTFVFTPCIFCKPYIQGEKYDCKRIQELREFQSKIKHHMRKIGNDRGRNRIGYSSDDLPDSKPGEIINHATLSLLSTKF